MSWFAKIVLVVGCLGIGVWTVSSRAEPPAPPQPPAPKGEVLELPLADGSNEAAIHQAMTEKTSVKWVDVPLRDAILELAHKHRIPIVLDEQKLQDEGVATDTPINLQFSGISLRSVFNLMLEPLQLTTVVRDEVLLVTTSVAAGEILTTEVYDVRKLVKDENYGPLIDVLTMTIQPDQWDAVGGPGGISEIPNGLVIRQTEAIHREIRQLLQELERVYTAPFGKLPPPALNTIEARLRHKLESPTSFNCLNAPLDSVLKSLSLLHGVQILLDVQKLQDEGVATDNEISINVQNVRLDSILNMMLRNLQLTWIIENEVLRVTTSVAAGERLFTKVYDVRDLESKFVDSTGRWLGYYQVGALVQGFGAGASVGGAGAGGGGMGGMMHGVVDEYTYTKYQWLIDVLTQQVQPDMWDAVGGEGSVAEFHGIFVIRQTQDIHAEIQRLLPRVRKVALAKAAEPPAAEKKAEESHPLVIYQVGEYPSADLERMLPAVVEPASWASAGGKGTIHAVKGAILVRQSSAVHREIGKVLRELGLHPHMGLGIDSIDKKPNPRPGGMGGGAAASPPDAATEKVEE